MQESRLALAEEILSPLTSDDDAEDEKVSALCTSGELIDVRSNETRQLFSPSTSEEDDEVENASQIKHTVNIYSPSSSEDERINSVSPTDELINATSKLVKAAELRSTDGNKDGSGLLQVDGKVEQPSPSPVADENVPSRGRKNSILRTPSNFDTDEPERKKSVSFNLRMNVTEIIESNENVMSDSDHTSSDDEEDKAKEMIAQKKTDDDDDDEDNDKETPKEDIERHEKEMNQLREEYKRRREDYYLELDSIQLQMDRKRARYKSELADYLDVIKMNERKDKLDDELQEIETKENELERRTKSVTERMKELEEREQYYARRQKGINEKEHDLFILQDELEALGSDLRKRERELKAKQKAVDDLEEELKSCPHDDKEIARTAALLENSRKDLTALQFRLDEKTEEMEQANQKLEAGTAENRRLQGHMRLLESQLSVSCLRASDTLSSNYDRRTSLRGMTGQPIDESTGEYLKPAYPNSPKISLSRTSSSPVSPSRIPHSPSVQRRRIVSSSEERRATIAGDLYSKPVQVVSPLHAGSPTSSGGRLTISPLQGSRSPSSEGGDYLNIDDSAEKHLDGSNHQLQIKGNHVIDDVSSSPTNRSKTCLVM